ncbi:dihydrodipicolinate synthase family protein [Consotaella salsifontis]|uniref:4-hydroxy-tetrahydrodipicolinate synthase n=1 Tax=Consotaella salsifontis TaxID=1365950 RepID=A0A1T4S713_9HYPH|nr:dihydrodipicolinate synthase family protein [Consotaella salsifontis]SKA24025.1 4-hydroxy-tetrahydrodipicolinate synthase [Consotaella salsifontis]
MPQFHGVIPPVATLFTPDGRFDPAAQGKLIDHLVDGGVHGLFFLGSAGEAAHMSAEMRLEVAEFCLKYLAGRRPALIGISVPSTAETIRFGHHAADHGADGVVAINPSYAALSEDGIYRYFRDVAAAVRLPLMVYNFPGVTKQDLRPELVLRLAMDCPSIVGLKDTVDTLSHIRRAIHLIKPQRPDFRVFAGYDEYLFGTLIMGGDGCVPASANFAPQLTCRLYEAYRAGDYGASVAWQQKLVHVPHLYAIESPFYAVVKEAMRQAGVCDATTVLAPATPLQPEHAEVVRRALLASGVL